MEMITKNVPKRLEFGVEGNWGTLVPENLYLRTINGDTVHAVITYNYGKNDGRTIDLCHENIEEIDFKSFDTTIVEELNKIGLKEKEVQMFKNQCYVIKEDDGTIVPFEKFEVKFNYVHPGQFGYTENKVITCDARSEDKALKYAERCVTYPSWMKNIIVTKVGNVNE